QYLEAQRRLWFGDALGTPDSLEWQLALARLLRSHGFLLRILLASMTSTAMESSELVERVGATLPAYGSPDPEYVELVIGSFLALLSAARIVGPAGPHPMIQVRY